MPEGQVISADLLLLTDGQTDNYNFNSMIYLRMQKIESCMNTSTTVFNSIIFCAIHNYRQLEVSKSGDISDGKRHMEKAIALDSSCLPAYNMLVTYEMQR